MEDIRGNRRPLDDVIVSSSKLMNLFPDGALPDKKSNTKATKIFDNQRTITHEQIINYFWTQSQQSIAIVCKIPN